MYISLLMLPSPESNSKFSNLLPSNWAWPKDKKIQTMKNTGFIMTELKSVLTTDSFLIWYCPVFTERSKRNSDKISFQMSIFLHLFKYTLQK